MTVTFNEVIEKFSTSRIGVIGDLMLDQFVWGEAERISPEAPIPVVLVQRENAVPGGAANTACNIASLGGVASLVGYIGSDDTGQQLRRELANSRIVCDHILELADRPTTCKRRIIARNQQLLRVDQEETQPITEATENKILSAVTAQILNWRALVISDYVKGLITPRLASHIIQLARAARVPVVVDTKSKIVDHFTGCTVITPNHHEAQNISGFEDVSQAGDYIREQLKSNVLITRGSDGMSLFTGPKQIHLPTKAREVYDVVGAGDTVVAALALALASGALIEDAAVIANHAAGIAVGKVGTATVTAEELLADMQKMPETVPVTNHFMRSPSSAS